MTEHRNPIDPDPQPGAAHDASGHGKAPDETFTWTDESEAPAGTTGHGEPVGAEGGAGASAKSTATTILESLRGAVDDLAERAAPTMRELSARAAELAAVAADRAAPLAKRAGEATAEVSGKLAAKSRDWAAEIRSSLDAADAAGDEPPKPAADAAGDEPPKPAADKEPPGPA